MNASRRLARGWGLDQRVICRYCGAALRANGTCTTRTCPRYQPELPAPPTATHTDAERALIALLQE